MRVLTSVTLLAALLGGCDFAPDASACAVDADCSFSEDELVNDLERCGPAEPFCNSDGLCEARCLASCASDEDCDPSQLCSIEGSGTGFCRSRG